VWAHKDKAAHHPKLGVVYAVFGETAQPSRAMIGWPAKSLVSPSRTEKPCLCNVETRSEPRIPAAGSHFSQIRLYSFVSTQLPATRLSRAPRPEKVGALLFRWYGRRSGSGEPDRSHEC